MKFSEAIKEVLNALASDLIESTAASAGYYNSGCWTDHHCNYLMIAEGRFELIEVNADTTHSAVETVAVEAQRT